MSLAIFDGERLIEEWHVGESSPMPFKDIHKITSIQVDGDELDYIYTMFSMHIPIPKGKVIKLFGDSAHNIVGNLTNTR